MHETRREQRPVARPRAASRRTLLRWSAGTAGAATLAAIPGAGWTQDALAQDEVILTAGAAEIGASPGSAYAQSAAAAAAAARGAARVQAAAALADAGGGAITRSPVASAAAIPGVGAEAQSAIAVASASSQSDADRAKPAAPMKTITPAGGGRGGRRGAGAGGRRRGGGRAVRAGRAGGRRRDRVGRLPDSGVGSEQSGSAGMLFAAASATMALGAFLLRRRAEPTAAALAVAIEE